MKFIREILLKKKKKPKTITRAQISTTRWRTCVSLDEAQLRKVGRHRSTGSNPDPPLNSTFPLAAHVSPHPSCKISTKIPPLIFSLLPARCPSCPLPSLSLSLSTKYAPFPLCRRIFSLLAFSPFFSRSQIAKFSTQISLKFPRFRCQFPSSLPCPFPSLIGSSEFAAFGPIPISGGGVEIRVLR